MTHKAHFALLTAAVAVTACRRSVPPQGSQASDSTPSEAAHPAAPRPPSDSPPSSTTQPAATALPGQGDTLTVSAPLRDAYHTAPLDTVDERTYQGWKYFNLNCSRCHGEDVMGTTLAPHLILSLKPDGPIPDEPTFQKTVCEGRPEKGMPAWCQLGLTPAQIDTVYAYVKGRSAGKLHPGRPARRAS